MLPLYCQHWLRKRKRENRTKIGSFWEWWWRRHDERIWNVDEHETASDGAPSRWCKRNPVVGWHLTKWQPARLARAESNNAQTTHEIFGKDENRKYAIEQIRMQVKHRHITSKAAQTRLKDARSETDGLEFKSNTNKCVQEVYRES